MKKLTPKRQLFVDYYVATMFNGTKAATLAGFSAKTAYSAANRLLKIDEVKAAVEERMAEMVMPAREVLMRLSDQGRGTMEDFTETKNGKRVPSLEKAAQAGKLHLVKKLEHVVESFATGDGDQKIIRETTKFELYDVQAALVHLGKYHKLFAERVEVFDWRKEMAEVGLDADAEKERLIAQFEEHIRSGIGRVDAGSVSGSQKAN